ncbi:hypothetical protein A6V36_14865 [Paraburkholderia ginsengiterrae]|uniref:DUF4136 domain-containing protein n=1 Tax=Paraburkholderia ginsengiterrae TaxID=1462993 RepID=A0ABX2UJJ3_9BURK|nr:hypothetical protein [Paraburkholderia ginsengiterrae]OAJ51850.1 hypothetical protein A6V36_14865 [Paraburkholderia ginsengiterrae]
MKSFPIAAIGRALVAFAAWAMLAAVLHAGVAHAVQASDSDALSLIITYQTAPANRPALRRELQQSTARELARWKHDGRIRQYSLLFNRYADSDNWDALAVLTFATPDDLYRWRTIEQARPAALSGKALAVTASIHTTPVDMKRTVARDAQSPNAVYVVIPYKTLVPEDEYEKYADGYVLPQFNGWMDEGVLSGYALYTSQFPAGRPWNAMVVLQYRNETALSAREAVVARVRERLKSNPEWKAISDSKKNVRTEEQVVIADPVAVDQ